MTWLIYKTQLKSGRRAILLFLLLACLLSFSSCDFIRNLTAPIVDIIPDEPDASPEITDPSWIIAPPDVDDPNQTSVVVDTTPTPDMPSPMPLTVTGPDLAEREPMDDAFFEDAAFMGNSLMDGFRMFSGLTTCDYYAATSMTVTGALGSMSVNLDNGTKGTMVDGLTQKPYGKIYILLGINEIGMHTSTFSEQYAEMLDKIREAQPDCDIYIMSLSPVSQAKSSSSDSFTMDRIREYNAVLYALAAEKDCYYLDLVDALADGTGFLPSAETSDGIHFSANLYNTWVTYVRTHYA